MKRPEELATPNLDGEQRESAMRLLRNKSLYMGGLGELVPKNMTTGSYRENGGVIIYSSPSGEIFATPSSTDSQEMLNNLGYFPDGDNKGVPDLNNKDTWKGRSEDLAKWTQLVGTTTSNE